MKSSATSCTESNDSTSCNNSLSLPHRWARKSERSTALSAKAAWNKSSICCHRSGVMFVEGGSRIDEVRREKHRRSKSRTRSAQLKLNAWNLPQTSNRLYPKSLSRLLLVHLCGLMESLEKNNHRETEKSSATASNPLRSVAIFLVGARPLPMSNRALPYLAKRPVLAPSHRY